MPREKQKRRKPNIQRLMKLMLFSTGLK
jgi:predicted nucleic acid-binding protein